MDDWDDMVLVGRVARTHGLRGDVVVYPETDFVAERFRVGERVWTRVAGRNEPLTITSARIQNGRPVVAFDGVARIEAAWEKRPVEGARGHLRPAAALEDLDSAGDLAVTPDEALALQGLQVVVHHRC